MNSIIPNNFAPNRRQSPKLTTLVANHCDGTQAPPLPAAHLQVQSYKGSFVCPWGKLYAKLRIIIMQQATARQEPTLCHHCGGVSPTLCWRERPLDGWRFLVEHVILFNNFFNFVIRLENKSLSYMNNAKAWPGPFSPTCSPPFPK